MLEENKIEKRKENRISWGYNSKNLAPSVASVFVGEIKWRSVHIFRHIIAERVMMMGEYAS